MQKPGTPVGQADQMPRWVHQPGSTVRARTQSAGIGGVHGLAMAHLCHFRR